MEADQDARGETHIVTTWVQIVIAAAAFLVACATLIVGTLMLVDRRAGRMEDKIEAARKEALDNHNRTDAKIDQVNEKLAITAAEVAELRGRLSSPVGPGPFSIYPSEQERRAS